MSEKNTSLNYRNSLLESQNTMYSIIAISLPMMATGLSEALYNMVDSIFVGRFIGETALAALTINSIIQLFLMALSTLYGAGMASIISRALGANNFPKVSLTIVNGSILCFITTFAISLLLLLNLDRLLMFLGSSENTLQYSREYAQIILWFGFLLPTNGVFNGILRASGEVKIVMRLAFLGAILNILLDALFIIVFKWGVAGAALATVIAQAIVFIILLQKIVQIFHVRLEWHYIKHVKWSLICEIYSIGISNFLRVLTFVIMGISANKTLVLYGTAALASYGIVNRILHLAYQPIFGSNLGTQSLIGFNYGANRFIKVQEIIKKGIIFATILGIIPSLIFIWAPDQLFRLFTDSDIVMQYTQRGSWIVGITFALYGIQIFSTGALIAMGRPKQALFFSILRPCLLVLGMNVLPIFFKLDGVWLSFTFTDIISTTLTIFVITRELMLLKQKEQMLKMTG